MALDAGGPPVPQRRTRPANEVTNDDATSRWC